MADLDIFNRTLNVRHVFPKYVCTPALELAMKPDFTTGIVLRAV